MDSITVDGEPVPAKRRRGPRNHFLNVERDKNTGRWRVCIQGCWVGMFDTALDAAHARDAVALRLKGDNAKRNIINDNAAQEAA